jgi:hypothetical protein
VKIDGVYGKGDEIVRLEKFSRQFSAEEDM